MFFNSIPRQLCCEAVYSAKIYNSEDRGRATLDKEMEVSSSIYDRGYPSFGLIYEHFERGIDFLIRVKTEFNHVVNRFYQSGLDTDIVKIYPANHAKLSDKPYSKDSFKEIRLVGVELSTTEVEILITSLLGRQEYTNAIFKEVYFLRWGVKTFYDELKNKIKAEYFSGYSPHSISPDFYATLFVSNIRSLIVGQINDELAKGPTQNKY